MQFYRSCKNLHFLKVFKVFENRLNHQFVRKKYGIFGHDNKYGYGQKNRLKQFFGLKYVCVSLTSGLRFEN